MVELADTLDLGSSAARRGGSSPSIRTTFPGRLEGREVYPGDAAVGKTFGEALQLHSREVPPSAGHNGIHRKCELRLSGLYLTIRADPQRSGR